MAEDQGDKKHDPTPHRLEEAKKKRQVAKSQDLATSIVLLLAIILLFTIGKHIVTDMYAYSHKMLSKPLLLVPEHLEPDDLKQTTLSLFHETVSRFLDYKNLSSLLYFFLLLIIVAVIANVAQVGFH